MLSDQEREEIAASIRQYGTKRAVIPEALQIVQQHRGWVSDDAVDDIAQFLGMTAEEVDGIATFYNLIFRRPVGRHVILVCNSVSCWIMGFNPIYVQLADHLGVRFGETTPDGRFTLLPTVCLGACDHAPAMMIDEDLHGDVTPNTLDDILARYP